MREIHVSSAVAIILSSWSFIVNQNCDKELLARRWVICFLRPWRLAVAAPRISGIARIL